MLISIIIAIVVVYLIAKKIGSSKLKANNDYFEQHRVRVNFKNGTISIKGHEYQVTQVTGIHVVRNGDGRTFSTRGVEIHVDDLNKPIHKITIGGWGKEQQSFAQRLCVALRKAGGPDFYF